jgi:cobalt-zinc-cadmium efflux system protein
LQGDHNHHQLSGKRLFLAIFLNVCITVAQVIGGIFSGSLALLGDALHNFSDVLSLIIAYGAHKLSSKEGNQKRTFGFRRAEILAALFNTSLLIGIALFLVVEAVEKFMTPQPIDSFWVIWLGLLGVVVNGLSVLLLKDDTHNNMNIKAAYLHLLSDVLTSVAVVVGGLLMYFYQLFWVDPLISVLIAFYIVKVSFVLVKSSVYMLMQFAPSEIDVDLLVQSIKDENENIEAIHHLHLWQLDEHRTHLEAHLDFNKNITLQESHEVIDALEKMLQKRYSIEHTIFQCEYNRCQDKSVIVH